MSTVGKRISERRKLQHISQEELAYMVGTDQRQISRYENDKNIPTAEVLSKIALTLNTTTDWLVGLTDYPERDIHGSGDLQAVEIEVVEILRRQSQAQRERMIQVIRTLATT